MTGCIDYSTEQFQVDGKYLLDGRDFDSLPGGGTAMRRTVEPLHTDDLPAKPISLIPYDRGNGQTVQLLIGLETGELRYAAQPDGVPIPTSQIIAGGSMRPWVGVEVDGQLYLQDGNAVPQRWDGSMLAALPTAYNAQETWNTSATYTNSGMPIARLLASIHNRIFAVTDDDTLRFSFPLTNAGGALDWGSGDKMRVFPGMGGRRVTAIVAANDRLFVFKEHATFQLLGYSPATFQLFPVSTEHGASGPEAVATDGTQVWAWDTTAGIHRVVPGNSGSMVDDEGAGFRPMFRLIREGRTTVGDAGDISVGYVNEKVMVSLAIDGQRETLVQDQATGGWTRYTLRLGAFDYFRSGGRSLPVACCWDPLRSQRVLVLDRDGDGDDDGHAVHTVPAWYRYAWMHGNLPTVPKAWPYVDFIMDAGFDQSVVVFMSTDWDIGTSIPLGVVHSDAQPLADPFVLDDSLMVDLQYERLSPTAELTARPRQVNPGADAMRASTPKTTRRRVRIPAVEASAVLFTVYGPTPSKRWAVRAIVPTYAVSRRPL